MKYKGQDDDQDDDQDCSYNSRNEGLSKGSIHICVPLPLPKNLAALLSRPESGATMRNRVTRDSLVRPPGFEPGLTAISVSRDGKPLS